MNDVTDNNNNDQRPRSPGVLKIMQSILAGAFGVQSDKRRQEERKSEPIEKLATQAHFQTPA